MESLQQASVVPWCNAIYYLEERLLIYLTFAKVLSRNGKLENVPARATKGPKQKKYIRQDAEMPKVSSVAIALYLQSLPFILLPSLLFISCKLFPDDPGDPTSRLDPTGPAAIQMQLVRSIQFIAPPLHDMPLIAKAQSSAVECWKLATSHKGRSTDFKIQSIRSCFSSCDHESRRRLPIPTLPLLRSATCLQSLPILPAFLLSRQQSGEPTGLLSPPNSPHNMNICNKVFV